MSDILSQTEIDQLLASLHTGEATAADSSSREQPRFRVHDFRTASRIPREQIKTLSLIHENFARLLSTYLTGTLGVLCDCSLASIEERTYFEFTNSISAQSLLTIVKMPPLQGSILLRISPEIAHAIVESLLGGTGYRTAHHRAFTEIDLVILEKILRQLLPLVNEAWDKVIKVHTTLDVVETSLQFAQIVPPNEAIVLVTLSLRIGDVDSLFNFCIPETALEPFANSLSNRLLASGRSEPRSTESFQDPLLKRLNATRIPLTGVLSETTITVQDLMGLQVGDVIQLDSRIQDPIHLRIGHIPRLKGVLGTWNRRYAIRITGIHDEEDPTHE